MYTVCGYGVADPNHSDSRHYAGLEEYAQSISDSASADPEETTWIFCGGRTNSDSRLSEAEGQMRLDRRFASQLLSLETPHLETKSRSTSENLFFAEEIIRRYRMTDDGGRVVIFCDRPRAKKVRWLASKLMVNYAVEVVPMRRPDPHRDSSRLVQAIRLLELKILWKRTHARPQGMSYFH